MQAYNKREQTGITNNKQRKTNKQTKAHNESYNRKGIPRNVMLELKEIKSLKKVLVLNGIKEVVYAKASSL